MILERCAPGYELDDDPRRVDRDVLCEFLTPQVYWGRWRGRQTIVGQLDSAWRVAGAYAAGDGAMVGFARAGHGFQAPDGTFLERPRPGSSGDSTTSDAEVLPSRDWLVDTRRSYDTVAPHHADQLRDALDARRPEEP